MGDFVKCFDIEELERLDPQQIGLLKEAIERELSNSPEIRSILRARVQSVYHRTAAKNTPPPTGQGPTGQGPTGQGPTGQGPTGPGTPDDGASP